MTEIVRYFAYGSNMASATLRGRRCIEFRSAVAARATGWRLVIDKPALVDVGHSYANIVPDSASEIWGVLYEITSDDLAHIDLTEGVLIDNYRRIAIHVTPLHVPQSRDAGASLTREEVEAFTLVSDRRDPQLQPSTRYMDLLISGAEEHGLPASYVAWLRAIPAQPESARAREFQPVLDSALRRE